VAGPQHGNGARIASQCPVEHALGCRRIHDQDRRGLRLGPTRSSRVREVVTLLSTLGFAISFAPAPDPQFVEKHLALDGIGGGQARARRARGADE